MVLNTYSEERYIAADVRNEKNSCKRHPQSRKHESSQFSTEPQIPCCFEER